MAAICTATCEADPGRDKYPKSVAANDKTTIIYFYSFASKLFPGLCLPLPLYPSVRQSVYMSASLSLARAHARALSFSCLSQPPVETIVRGDVFKFIRTRN